MIYLGSPRRSSPALGRWSLVFVALGSASLVPRMALAEGSVRLEARQQVTAVLLPSHPYGATGSCATGTGLAQDSEFAHGAGGGTGIGAGLGVRAFFQEAPGHPSPRESTWWGLRVGGGLDVDLLYARVATDKTERLCAQVERDGADMRYGQSSVLLLQVPVLFGAELGLRTSDDERWHGIVLSWAWAPALTFVKPWVARENLSASYLGTELAVDLAADRDGTSHGLGKRVALFFLLPGGDDGPTVLTLSFGAVWY